MKLFWIALTVLSVGAAANAQSQSTPSKPEIRVFKTVGTTKITAHIFYPERSVVDKPAPVIVLIHGGGWSAGSPEWVYADARRYAEYGAVAVARGPYATREVPAVIAT